MPANAPFRLIESKTLELTQEFLDEFLRFPPSPTERARNEKRIKHLRNKYDNGLWGPCVWVTVQCNGVEYRINGQHSSSMLKALNGSFADGLMVHWDRWTADTMDDTAMLYRQYDDRMSSRKPADVANAYQGLEEDLRNVAPAPAKLAVEAVNWWRDQVDRAPSSKDDDRYTLFHEAALHPFIKWVAGEIFCGKVPELARIQIVAAMFVTFEANEIEARSFWRKVSQGGDEYQEGAPDRVLADWLHDIRRKEHPEFQKVSGPEAYQGCIYAWNAHRRGEPSIKTIRYDTKRHGYLKVIA